MFDDPQEEYICEETGEEILLMKDKSGRVIGFEKLNYSLSEAEKLHIAFETVAAWKSTATQQLLWERRWFRSSLSS